MKITSDMSPLSALNTHSVSGRVGHGVADGLNMVVSSVVTLRITLCPKQKADSILWIVKYL